VVWREHTPKCLHSNRKAQNRRVSWICRRSHLKQFRQSLDRTQTAQQRSGQWTRTKNVQDACTQWREKHKHSRVPGRSVLAGLAFCCAHTAGDTPCKTADRHKSLRKNRTSPPGARSQPPLSSKRCQPCASDSDEADDEVDTDGERDDAGEDPEQSTQQQPQSQGRSTQQWSQSQRSSQGQHRPRTARERWRGREPVTVTGCERQHTYWVPPLGREPGVQWSAGHSRGGRNVQSGMCRPGGEPGIYLRFPHRA
jgi:hypothetical protein